MKALTGSWVAARYALDPRRVDAMRRAGELVGVRRDGDFVYPAWQFDEAGPLPQLSRIVAEARRSGIDGEGLCRLLEAHEGLTGDGHLHDALRSGNTEHILATLRSRPR